MSAVPLADARDERRYGGKAVQLGAAIRAGLPVPAGLALSVETVEALARGDRAVRDHLEDLCDELGGPLAVRSSAVGEDSAEASFAGQHATVLNVGGSDVADAVARVWRSGSSPSALAYRRRVGDDEAPRMGVVVQRLAAADVAGVMFTRDPVTGADQRVIEASWGLGEAIVQGLVVPDLFRVSRDGEVLERRAGRKDLAVRPSEAGETEQRTVDGDLVEALCLDDAMLGALADLATGCERAFGPGPHDVEWGFAGGDVLLLQRRAITAMAAPANPS